MNLMALSIDGAGSDRLFRFEPPRTATANLVLIHGLGDHAGRNLRLAARLASAGYRTFLFDLAGHGASPHRWDDVRWVYQTYATLDSGPALVDLFQRCRREDPQATRELAAAQYDQLTRTGARDHLAQLLRVVAAVRRRGDRTPLFLLGHSMGALLAAEASWRLHAEGAAPEGVVFVAPAFRPRGNPDSPAMQLAVDGAWATRDTSVLRFALKRVLDLNLPVDMTWGGKWLSDVRDQVAVFENDPLVPRQLPTRYASSIESLMVRVDRRRAFPVPGLVIVPGRDGIVNRDAAVDFARRANAESGAGQFELVEFGVTAHDVLRSTAGERAMQTILAWLDAKTRGGAVAQGPGVLSKAS